MAPVSSNFVPNLSCGPCIYCHEKNESSPEEFLKCDHCNGCSHISCLKSGYPSNRLKGDNFFHFTCTYCSACKSETVHRVNIPIIYAMLIAMYNLHLANEDESVGGYFHYKKHLHAYMMNKWRELFDFDGKKSSSKDKSRLQPSCVSGILSQSNYFVTRKIGRGGWYRLREIKSPAFLIYKYGPKKRPNTNDNIKEELKKIKVSDQISHSFVMANNLPFAAVKEEVVEDSPAESVDDNSSRGSWFTDKDIIKPGTLPPPSIFDCDDEEDLIVEVKDESADLTAGSDDSRTSYNSGTVAQGRPSLFTKAGPSEVAASKEILSEYKVEKMESLTQLSTFEENKLLNQLEKLYNTSSLSPRLYRLRRKLKTRRLKREHGLPLFNIDAEIAFLNANGRLMTSKENKLKQIAPEQAISFRNESSRILDRFQLPEKSYIVKKEFSSFRIKLIGESDENLDYIYSPYTLRNLKPYIFRDYSTVPLKLKLLQEIAAYPFRNDANWKPPPRRPIDYCYITHKHIPSVNQLARQFFWPGIELSEVLQYPDFTCVALYAKLVIGFGVIVPDTSQNEAYVSFLLVHPDWRRAGIAKFMLYHLIQTCSGKDITLHASATNPALIMYQQFGFKVEEFLTDFYDKYLEEDSQDCKHAMFMRLSR